MEDRIPSRDEPDPLNIRQRSFQGGANGLPNPTGEIPEKYKEGPQGTGSGVSGLATPPVLGEG